MTPKSARRRALPRGKAASARDAGRDSGLIERLETIAQGLGQIADLRAELADLRAIVEKLVQAVSALINSQAEERCLEQRSSAGGEEVLIIESYGVAANEAPGNKEEEPERQYGEQD